MITREPTTPIPNTWHAPDAAVWELETAHGHCIAPVVLRDQSEQAFAEGFRKSFATLGVPLSHIELRHVNGWPYVSTFLHDVPRKAGGPPPDVVLKAITRLHPGFRRRTKVARSALAERRPQRFATDWFAERQAWITRIIGLQRDDLASLTDQELADHTRAVSKLAVAGLQRHFELVPGCIPLGAWLHRATQWGLDPAATRQAVMHDTPVHTEASRRLDRIAGALGDTACSTFDEIRSHSSEAAEALDDYLAHHGWWATEDALNGRAVRDFPATVVATIRACTHHTSSAVASPDLIESIRRNVPAAERAEFDELVTDAHQAYTMLDDNSGILGSWAVGVAGQGLRAVGQRLGDDGRIHQPAHMWALTLDEILDLLERRSPLSADDAAARHAEWQAQAQLVAPPSLNGAPAPPPDSSVFPAPVASLVTSLTTFLADKFGQPDRAVGIGNAPARGRAVVAADASDAIDRILPGDILVTGATTPAYTAILPMLSGLVVTEGGASCHAAVVARELQLTAIIGYADALTAIPDGAMIELDPEHATVHLAPAG